MKIVVVSVLVLLMTGPAMGSELSVVGGLGPVEDLAVETLRFDLRNLALVGLRFEKDFLWFLGFENSFMYTSRLLQPVGEEGQNGIYWTANLVLNLPNEKVVPNLVLGMGVMQRFGDSFPDAGASFLTNWGVGVKFRELAGPLGVRVDYRRIQVHGVEDQSLLLQELSGGLLIQF